MKYLMPVLLCFFLANLSAQTHQISSTQSFRVSKKAFKKNQITFEIENTYDQPFIAFDIRINGLTKKNINVTIQSKVKETKHLRYSNGMHSIIDFIDTKNKQKLNQDIHFNNENSWSSELQFLSKRTQSITIKIENAGNKIEDIDFNFFYPNKTKDLLKSKQTDTIERLKATPPPPISCSCPIPAYESRADWDPSGSHPAQTSPTYTTVTHLIVHHAAGPNTSSDWAATVRSIWNYHVNSNGWSDIGYNYLIDPNGVIYEGRGDNVLGAHFSGMNGGTMGVCLLGNYQPDASENVNPSTAMQNSLIELLSWKECDLSKDPLSSSYHNASSQNLMHIAGHRDAGTGTQCPGDNVYDILPNLRSSCSSYVQNCSFTSDADLVVSSLNTNPSNVVIAQNTDINIGIGNAGSQDVIELINFILAIEGDTLQTYNIDSVLQGQIVNFSFPNYQFTSLGSKQICVYVSSASNESNTLNNSFCTTIQVQDSIQSLSDLVIQSIISTPTQAWADSTTSFDFNIKNIGDAPSTSVDGSIEIDGITRQLFSVPNLNVNDVFVQNYSFQFNSSGNHQVCVLVDETSNEDNIVNNSYCKTIIVENIANSINDRLNIETFKIYPNPSKNKLNISLLLVENQSVNMSISNILGQKILEQSFENNTEFKTVFDLSNHSQGLYVLEIEIANNVLRKKFLKEN